VKGTLLDAFATLIARDGRNSACRRIFYSHARAGNGLRTGSQQKGAKPTASDNSSPRLEEEIASKSLDDEVSSHLFARDGAKKRRRFLPSYAIAQGIRRQHLRPAHSCENIFTDARTS